MSVRWAALGLGVAAALGPAQAQDAAFARFTAVDAAGRVLPVAARSSAADRGTTMAASPCPKATAMPANEARALVARIAAEEGFFPEFVHSVAKAESGFNSIALSGKGAFGLMQLEAATAKRFAVDLCDPASNVRGGIRFLRALHTKYRNPLFILAAYNAGEGAVAQNRGVPPFPETVRFIAQVINDFYAWPDPADAAGRTDRGAAQLPGPA